MKRPIPIPIPTPASILLDTGTFSLPQKLKPGSSTNWSIYKHTNHYYLYHSATKSLRSKRRSIVFPVQFQFQIQRHRQITTNTNTMPLERSLDPLVWIDCEVRIISPSYLSHFPFPISHKCWKD